MEEPRGWRIETGRRRTFHEPCDVAAGARFSLTHSTVPSCSLRHIPPSPMTCVAKSGTGHGVSSGTQQYRPVAVSRE